MNFVSKALLILFLIGSVTEPVSAEEVATAPAKETATVPDVIEKPIVKDSFIVIDEALLYNIEHDTFNFFITYTDEKTGLTKDSSRRGAPASVAASGFYAAALAIGENNGWITEKEAIKRLKNLIYSLNHRLKSKNGFYYHFVDMHTGKRVWHSEISSIDTALLMAGLLFSSEYFANTQLSADIDKLYRAVNWKWMQNNTNLLSHGYKPESGFLPYYWDMYSEHLILQALALGSPTHPISPKSWHAWNRYEEDVDGRMIVYSYPGSLFTYQYSHSFIDFGGLQDKGINYADNSRFATEENKAFCDSKPKLYQGYWGLSASVGPSGYRAYGAPPATQFTEDGTIAPHASIGSITFTPEASCENISRMYKKLGNKVYKEYGFVGAFNLKKNWFADEYLGIDQGIILLMLENYRNQTVWKYFMDVPAIQDWIERCALRK